MRTKKTDLFRGTEKSVWRFWRDGVSSSLLAVFLACREQARLQLVEGLRSSSEKIYLGFGTCGHWLLHNMYDRQKPSGPIRISRWIREYSEAWTDEVPRATRTMRDQQDHIYGLHGVLMPRYAKRWAGDWRGSKYPLPNVTVRPRRWLQLEHEFRTWWVFGDGRKVPIRGMWDGVFVDRYGLVWIFDTKCLSVIIPEDLEETMSLNLQFMLYLWAYRNLHGTTPRGFLLNICRRPGHRFKKNESKVDFYDRVRGEIKLRPDHFFQRYELTVKPSDIRRWESLVLAPLMDDIRGWWEGRRSHYLNPNALISKYGRCEMFHAIVSGNRSGTYVVDDVYGYRSSLFGG